MRSRTAIAMLVVAVAAPALLTACSGTAPEPTDPQLDEALTEFGRGRLTADIEVGGTYDINPQTLDTETGTKPSCDNFQFDFSWQVTNTYPPNGVSLEWYRVRGDVLIASASNGEQAVGCDTVQARNTGPTPITLAIKYAIGGIPQ